MVEQSFTGIISLNKVQENGILPLVSIFMCYDEYLFRFLCLYASNETNTKMDLLPTYMHVLIHNLKKSDVLR